jgi:hypothetical protein
VEVHLDERGLATDYLQLLRRGSVMRRLAPAHHVPWERAIRGRADTDGLRVRTWSREDATVCAVLRDWAPTRAEREALWVRLAWLRED